MQTLQSAPRLLASALLMSGLVITPVAAQSATINVTATVLTTLQVSATQDMVFPPAYTGGATVHANSSSSWGAFSVDGTAGAQVALTFTLPTVLTSGAATLPITFQSNHGQYYSDAVGSFVSFDPAVGATFTLPADGTAAAVRIFASITAPLTQEVGAYTGEITLTAAYTGN